MLNSWIPSDDGGLYREWNDPSTGTGLPAGEVKLIFQFDWVGPTSNLVRYFFAAVATSPGASTFNLWSYDGVSVWTQVTAVGVLQKVPSVAKVQSSSLLHLSDGTTNWLFDGTTWLIDGMQIPLTSPAINVSASWLPNTSFASFVGYPIIDSNGYFQLRAGFAGTTGSTPPAWSKVLGSLTSDNGVAGAWRCLGIAALWQPNTAYAQYSAILDSNGNIQYLSAAGGTSGASPPVWAADNAASPTADNGLSWTLLSNPALGINPPIFGSAAQWQGGTNFTLPFFIVDLNGNMQVLTGAGVSSDTVPNWNSQTGGSTVDNAATWLNVGSVLAVPAWQATQAYIANNVVVDTNGNVQIVTTPGTSGATQPVWAVATYATTSDGGVVWTNQGKIKTGVGIQAQLGKYYWFTNADHTVPRVHESSSSGISLISGPLFGDVVRVYQQPGLFSSTSGSATITTSQSLDYPGPQTAVLVPAMIGQVIYLNGTLVGTIKAIDAANRIITLVVNSAVTVTNKHAVICDARATHWHVYASESDGSKIGEYVAAVPVTQPSDFISIRATPYIDMNPFVGISPNFYLPIFRPVRNDPPPTSLLAEVHKYRIFRRRESRKNFFNFTANEEVSSGLNGDPTQCVPGADVNTLSDIVDEQVFPDASNFIRALCSHGDALYIGTEKQTLPLYGQSIDDFGLSQVTAFSVGIAGKQAMISTAHGLAIVSYDRKVYVYPTSNYYWAYVPNDVNVTDNLLEVGKPLRKVLEQIDPVFLGETSLTFYFYGRRNWLVLTFRTKSATYQTWVYDFTNKGWFQLANGYAFTAVWEISTGNKILVGGSPTSGVFVIDDLTGTFTSSGNQPNSVWRPALIDFGDPDMKHIPLYIEFEVSNALMANDISINYYLDPVDVDNPGSPRNVIFQQVSGSNLYRGFFPGGNLCQRLLIELNAKASPVSTNSGHIRGIKLVANPASGLIR